MRFISSEICMKKLLLTLGLLFVFVIGLGTEAFARDNLARHFGIGIDSTISTYSDEGRGISAVYYINKLFGMQLIFGLNTTTAEVKGNDAKYDTTIIEYNVAIRALLAVFRTKEVHLTAVIGVGFSGRASDGFNSKDEDWSKYNDGFQVSIDVGLRPEYFITDNFSIHTQVGIGLDIITDNGSVLAAGLDKANSSGETSTDASGVSVDFFRNANIIAMAGCTFWF